jgi:hypothetical protein
MREHKAMFSYVFFEKCKRTQVFVLIVLSFETNAAPTEVPAPPLKRTFAETCFNVSHACNQQLQQEVARDSKEP